MNSDNNNTIISYKSGSGRRLYDVVSVLTGLNVITSDLDAGERCYKSKYVRLNEEIFNQL